MVKCPHNREKYRCKDCGGKGICEHNRVRIQCKECGGSQICKHNKFKASCKDCDGSQMCIHNRQKSKCTDCNGNSICKHKIRKSRCIICDGSELCEHNRQKSQCIDCKGGSICKHNKRKSYCKECKGTEICEHNKQKAQCIDCKGRDICKHNKVKWYCKECDGSRLCKTNMCEIKGSFKFEGYCLNCFIHLFPDRPNSRNYKTKERSVIEYILTKFPKDTYSWISDRIIQDGCSKRRPDLILDLGYQVIIIEVDENQHQDYICSCENKRIMELSKDINHRPLILIRFNPDDYILKNEKISSCWGINKLGICTIKKNKNKEWNDRLNILTSQILYWCQESNTTDKIVEVIQLFYNDS